jgi:murein DD-endopeptidase MepM/ murein hydrolase activator NlpD
LRRNRNAEPAPGELEASQVFNDEWRGWPVRPHHRPHPIRGSFLDPRPDVTLGATYHNGLDVAVRDDRPERGAPAGRTHRVFAIEGGRVTTATRPGIRGLVDIGHFRYEHVDALVKTGQLVEPGQPIGWTWLGTWHVHLGERIVAADGQRHWVNPLRPGGKIEPYVDRARPEIQEIRYYTPASPSWRRRIGHVVRLPQAGRRLDKRRLSGAVDVRVRASDPQSFIGWFSDLPWLAAPHHPFRLAVTIVDLAAGRIVERRDVFRSEQYLQLPADQHYAPGTDQNLPANACMRRHRHVRCDGIYWFRLYPRPYWDTTRIANGRYRLRVRAWDVAGNTTKADSEITIKN